MNTSTTSLYLYPYRVSMNTSTTSLYLYPYRVSMNTSTTSLYLYPYRVSMKNINNIIVSIPLQGFHDNPERRTLNEVQKTLTLSQMIRKLSQHRVSWTSRPAAVHDSDGMNGNLAFHMELGPYGYVRNRNSCQRWISNRIIFMIGNSCIHMVSRRNMFIMDNSFVNAASA